MTKKERVLNFFICIICLSAIIFSVLKPAEAASAAGSGGTGYVYPSLCRGGTQQLLCHWRLYRRRDYAGAGDSECIGHCGCAAPDGRDIPLCFQWRFQYDLRVGLTGLYQSHGYPSKCQLCGAAYQEGRQGG